MGLCEGGRGGMSLSAGGGRDGGEGGSGREREEGGGR